MKGQSSCSQEASTGPSYEPDESNPHLQPLFLRHFNIIFPSTPSSPFRCSE